MEIYNPNSDKQNEFLISRRAIYENDALAEKEAPSVDIKNGDNTSQYDKMPFAAEEVIIPKKRRTDHTVPILLILACGCAVMGFAMCGSVFEYISKETVSDYLTLRIKGGFFQNAASSFLGSLFWLLLPFFMGFCAIGQPATVCTILFKGLGTGISAASIINMYGLNGIPTILVWLLPSAVIGTAIAAYQCKASIFCSSRIFSYITGRFSDARPTMYYSGYISRSIFSAVCCFLLGITEAVLSAVFSGMFVI